MNPMPYSVVIPCYNEELSVAEVVSGLFALPPDERPAEVIVVNDGSEDGTHKILEDLRLGHEGLRVLHHEANLGYGASLKTGIARSSHDLVAIVDADGTYPLAQLPVLARRMDFADMAVGARTGADVHIPRLRRPAKRLVACLAETLSGRAIPDLNSGMRMMRRAPLLRFLPILPDAFSFTTTLTLAMLSNGLRVEYVPIDYRRRKGRSKIRPIRDTLNFLQLVCRTVMWFNPLRVFVPMSALLVLSAIGVFVGSWLFHDEIMDVTFGVLVMTGVFVLAVGMLADLIDKRMR